ncbi:MAG: ANTAR domain-containing protein, partial [Pirellulaceae bacterium]|nr:ANTAR domain-containing protein [Pirellulaceae bacterium]
AQEEHILGFLVKPVTEKELVPAIAIVMRRFAEFESLKKENASLQQTLQDRKVIERAKGILMRQASITEEDAFRRLQKLARDKRTKLAEIAAAVVTANEALS